MYIYIDLSIDCWKLLSDYTHPTMFFVMLYIVYIEYMQ